MRMRKKQMHRLAAEIQELDRERRRSSQPLDEDSLTPAEQAFVALADQRGKVAYRHGWPDFLVTDPMTGGVVGVEVKDNDDALRPSQCVMFAALESAGLRVFVWDRRRPNALTPWHMYDSRPARDPREKTGPRQHVLGRVQNAKRRR